MISIFIKEKWDIGYINDFYGTDYKTLSSMCQDAYILHFAGDIKPWTHKIQLNNLTKHYLDLVNNSLIHGFEKKHKRRQNLKPYIFFPYYLCAVIFMRYVLLPIKKYQNKHKR